MTRSDRIVIADADNTLWDTNSVFAEAQLKLLELVERLTRKPCLESNRLAFVRAYDQALASRHHQHLKYPRQMLIATLAAGLDSVPADTAAIFMLSGRLRMPLNSQQQIDEILIAYGKALNQLPDLLPTVRAGLELAKSSQLPVYVMTEGKIDLQKSILSTHHLENYVDGVWELTKTIAQFDRLMRKFQPATVVVIGDQPDRDIVPAHAAGCITALIPSKFKPRWQQEDDESAADLVAPNFLSAIEWATHQLNLEPC